MNFVINLIIGLAFAFIASLFAPKQKAPKPGTVGDVPRTQEGAEVWRGWGTFWLRSPMIHWYGDQDTSAIKG